MIDINADYISLKVNLSVIFLSNSLKIQHIIIVIIRYIMLQITAIAY